MFCWHRKHFPCTAFVSDDRAVHQRNKLPAACTKTRLGYEEMGKENHVLAPAYKSGYAGTGDDLRSYYFLIPFAQYEKYKDICQANGVSVGIHVNPSARHRSVMTFMIHAVMHRDLESQSTVFRKFSQRGLKDFAFSYIV